MNPLERVRSGQVAVGNGLIQYLQWRVLPVHTGAVLQSPLASQVIVADPDLSYPVLQE